MAASGCAPPLELTPEQEQLTARCLELAFKQETDPACAEGVTEPMKKAFLERRPDFHERLIAERKKFVEAQIAEDVRRRDALNQCLADQEEGVDSSAACTEFMPHEIARGLKDRKLRRCAGSQLDQAADASQQCDGLTDREIAAEIDAERGRRARAQ